jgi:hypothetical protein
VHELSPELQGPGREPVELRHAAADNRAGLEDDDWRSRVYVGACGRGGARVVRTSGRERTRDARRRRRWSARRDGRGWGGSRGFERSNELAYLSPRAGAAPAPRSDPRGRRRSRRTPPPRPSWRARRDVPRCFESHDKKKLSRDFGMSVTRRRRTCLRAVPRHSDPAPAPRGCCAPGPREPRGSPCDGSSPPTPRRPTAPRLLCARTPDRAFEAS